MDSRIPITELSSLTRKSRPTIYKYLSLYQEKDYGSVPYAFVTLFKMMDDPAISKKEILDYIEKAFPSSPRAGKMGEAIRYIEDHASSIDFDALLSYLKGENPHE